MTLLACGSRISSALVPARKIEPLMNQQSVLLGRHGHGVQDAVVVKDGNRSAFPLEATAVWLLYVFASVEMLVTYWRVPAHELYHVTGSGPAGAASRVLVFANFSAALAAIAVLAFVADRARSRATVAAAIAAGVLCAAVFWPGVVDEADLDARPVNAVAAVGVLIALALTVLALREGTAWSGRNVGDGVRAVGAAAAIFVSLPWIAAELGFFLDGVPGLGSLFQTGDYLPAPHPPAVHHGHHHGMDGLLLLLCAVLLSRAVPSLSRRGLRIAVGAYLALMASYGIANIANDFWIEQVVKRGWTTWQIPNVLHPTLTVAWGLIVLGAGALYAASVWWSRSSAQHAALTPVAHV
jgi:hypothetical protein